MASSTMAVTTAVTTIRRPTARCVAASRCLVFARNGTRATWGPMPISRSRSSLTTSSASTTAKFIANLTFNQAFWCPPFSFVSPFVASVSSFNLRSWAKRCKSELA